MKKFTKTLLASSLALASMGASAAAFQLAEISSVGLGRAYAGDAAVADSAAVIATNPALMTQFKQVEVSAGGVLVDADVDIEGTFGGRANADHKNVIPTAVVPNLYMVAPINDRFAIGGGANVNYGLKSEFGQDYSAGVFGGKTDLTAINLNLSGAYNVGYGLSVGAGLNAIYSKAELERYLGAAGQGIAARLQAAGSPYAATVARLPSNTLISRLEGDKWSFGWNAGLVYEFNERNRIGFSYHSAVNVKFKGEYSNAIPTAYQPLINQLLAGGLPFPVTQATGGQAVPGRLSLHLPAYWEVAGYHKLTDKFAVQYSVKRTEWSRFKSLDAYGANNVRLLHKTENFSDSTRIALGVSYDLNEALTLRAGIAHDENASVNNPSISIPDTDRTWYTVGATVRFTPNLSADVGYAHLRGSKNTFNEDGLAQFTAKSKANLYGLNLNYKF